jgi:hypothetical protein
MTQAKLEKLTKLWQKRLRLQDWDITSKFVQSVEGVEAANLSDVFGGTQCKPTFQEALIQIRIGLDDKETELTLVHELIHVVFGGLQTPEGLYNHLMETGIEKTARIMIGAFNA